MTTIGNHHQSSQVRRIAAMGLPPPTALTGPSSIGKLHCLLEELRGVLSENDLHVAEPGVDGMRQASSFCRDMPYSSPYRAVVIDGLDGMSDQSHDACLKLLEEPMGSSTVFLVLVELGSLPPALFSRISSVIRFSELSPEAMREFALSKCPSVDELALSLSFGRPGLYETISSSPALSSLSESVSACVSGTRDPLTSPVPEAFSKMKDKGPLFREAAISILERVPRTVPEPLPERLTGCLHLASRMRKIPSLVLDIHWPACLSGLSL
jgi:hypothetical protein